MCGEPLREPKSLTIEELRERDGKLVWVEPLSPAYASGWCVVDGTRVRVPGRDYFWFDINNGYGVKWLAYGREPKGAQQ